MAIFGEGKPSNLEEYLKAEVDRLQAQIERLQDALIAKESPEAYRDMLMTKLDDEASTASTANMDRLREESEVIQQIAAGMEKPVFNDAEDMVSKLSQIVGVNMPGSVHDNEES
jgi:cell division protein FtsB